MASSSPTATVVSDRYNDMVLLQATAANEDGDTIMRISLPQVVGDVVILEIAFNSFTFATIAANFQEFVVWASIVANSSGAWLDIVGGELLAVNRGTFAAPTNLRLQRNIKPDVPVLWRQGERLEIQLPELDTNATPTADIEVYIRAQRYRPRVN